MWVEATVPWEHSAGTLVARLHGWNMSLHAHAHRHMHAHTCTGAPVARLHGWNISLYMRTHTDTCTHTHAQVHWWRACVAGTCPCTCAHIHTCTRTHTQVHHKCGRKMPSNTLTHKHSLANGHIQSVPDGRVHSLRQPGVGNSARLLCQIV